MADGMASTDPAPEGVGYDDLVAEADSALETGATVNARAYLRQALGLMGNDPAVWQKLADVTAGLLEAAIATGQTGNYDLASEVTYAALNAFLRSEAKTDRAAALATLARGLEGREMWPEAIATYRDSVALVADKTTRGAARTGRRRTRLPRRLARRRRRGGHSRASAPSFPNPCRRRCRPRQLCLGRRRSAPRRRDRRHPDLPRRRSPTAPAITSPCAPACPRPSGEKLRDTVDLDLFVPDRSPFVGFANTAYVMPAGLGGGLPITSVNATSADIAIYRIGDRSIASAVRDGVFQQTLDGYSAEDIADRTGQLEFEGTVDLAVVQAQ